MTWYCLKSTWPSLSMKIKIGSIGSSNFPQSQSIAGATPKHNYIVAYSGDKSKEDLQYDISIKQTGICKRVVSCHR